MGTKKEVVLCEKCHKGTALATIEHQLLCKKCYEVLKECA